jgi:S-adenosylmethionine hydrolase
MQSHNVSAATSFRPSGVITLLSDFGLTEPYVGIMKGVILSRCPTARLIDLTHQVLPLQFGIAGFWLARCWSYFPEGTLHLAVVDPGVGTERGMVVLAGGGHAFIAPDNGLLDPVFRSLPDARWQSFQIADVLHLLAAVPGHTFHGRDIFAPLVAEIVAGRLSIFDLGSPKQPPLTDACLSRGVGKIIGIDHFGNLISDITSDQLAGLKSPVVQFRGQRIPVYKSYGFAPVGTLLALSNSWGTLEIAEAQGSAQRTLQAQPGEAIAVMESADASD